MAACFLCSGSYITAALILSSLVVLGHLGPAFLFPPAAKDVSGGPQRPRIPVHNVPPAPFPNQPLDGKSYALSLDPGAEGFSHLSSQFVALEAETTNPLMAAVFYAFAHHIPLELTPDVILNTILHGVSAHIAKDPQHLLPGKLATSSTSSKNLITNNNYMRRGEWNDWSSSVSHLGAQIRADVSAPTARAAVATKFSTTTLAEATGHTAAFRRVSERFYRYKVRSRCGIPFVELAGSRQDWAELARVVAPLLAELGLEDWSKELLPLLQKFVDAFNGKVDQTHWAQMYSAHGTQQSGGVSKVSGWIGKLFLYVRGGRNPLLLEESSARGEGNETAPGNAVPLADFPSGRTVTRFTWEYLGTDIPMRLIAGAVGVSLTPNGALKPEVGWVVAAGGQVLANSVTSSSGGADES